MAALPKKHPYILLKDHLIDLADKSIFVGFPVLDTLKAGHSLSGNDTGYQLTFLAFDL